MTPFLPGQTNGCAMHESTCGTKDASEPVAIKKPVCGIELMIAKKTLLLTLGATLLMHLGAQANDIEPGKEFYSAVPAANPIVLDGDLSEWNGVAVENPQFSIPKGSASDPNVEGQFVVFEPNGGDWTGPEDQSSSLRVVYDDANVYVGLIVTDEYHENAQNSAWNGDTVQMMVANDARDTQVGLYNYALGGVEGALGAIIVNHEAGPGGTDGVVTRDADAKLTTYEIKLPKESLALTELTSGVQFGLGMAINDGDEATPGQGGWGGLGAHSIVFSKSPEETALVTLAVPEPSGISLSMVAIGALLLRRRRTHR